MESNKIPSNLSVEDEGLVLFEEILIKNELKADEEILQNIDDQTTDEISQSYNPEPIKLPSVLNTGLCVKKEADDSFLADTEENTHENEFINTSYDPDDREIYESPGLVLPGCSSSCEGKTLNDENIYEYKYEVEENVDQMKLDLKEEDIYNKSQLDSSDINNDHKCLSCNESFSTRYELLQHLMKGHRENICNVCGKTFTKKGGLSVHLFLHKENKTYSCNRCNSVYSTKGDFITHLSSHQEVYECDICRKELESKSKIRKHMRTHRMIYKCTICSKLFQRKHFFTKHQSSHKTSFQCEDCKKGFATKQELTKHLKTHTTRVYNCNICWKMFKCESDLNIHVTKHEIKCKVCGKVFQSKSSLCHHLPHCKSYTCEICNMSFTYKYMFTKHLLSHQPTVKSFICQICSKTFAEKKLLSIHLLSAHLIFDRKEREKLLTASNK